MVSGPFRRGGSGVDGHQARRLPQPIVALHSRSFHGLIFATDASQPTGPAEHDARRMDCGASPPCGLHVRGAGQQRPAQRGGTGRGPSGARRPRGEAQRAGPRLSPSMDLKSLTIAMPRPAVEYSMVSTTTSQVSVPNSACAARPASAAGSPTLPLPGRRAGQHAAAASKLPWHGARLVRPPGQRDVGRAHPHDALVCPGLARLARPPGQRDVGRAPPHDALGCPGPGAPGPPTRAAQCRTSPAT